MEFLAESQLPDYRIQLVGKSIGIGAVDLMLAGVVAAEEQGAKSHFVSAAHRS